MPFRPVRAALCGKLPKQASEDFGRGEVGAASCVGGGDAARRPFNYLWWG